VLKQTYDFFNTVHRPRILKHGVSGYEFVRVIDDGDAVFEEI